MSSSPYSAASFQRRQRGTKTIIGLVSLGMALTLLYFSARPTLQCAHAGASGIDCQITARVLGLIPVHQRGVSGVRSIAKVESESTSSRSQPRGGLTGSRGSGTTIVRQLKFVTDTDSTDLGYFADMFAGDWQKLDEFTRNAMSPELRSATPVERDESTRNSLSTELRLTKPVAFRAIAAHFAALVLLLIGGGVVSSALRRDADANSGC